MVHDYKKILFTTDLSQRSKEVFDYTVGLAAGANSKIIILHVIEDEQSRTKDLVVDMIGKDAYSKIQQENEMHARSILVGKQKEVPILKEALEKLGQSVTTKGKDGDDELIDGVVIRIGKLVDEILQVAKESDCDMIVMGHHQKSMLKNALIGSCVRGVLRKSTVPVFLVPIDQ